MLDSSLPPVVCMGFMSFLRYVCVCLRIVVSNTYRYCVVVFLFLFVLCCVYPDVYLTVLWIFHPSQAGSTIQFEKHASQKQVVFFTTIPPTLRIITACTCKVPITCLPACTCKVPITCLPASPARSFWTFEHCDFVTETYFIVQFSCALLNWKRPSVCELRYVVVNYVTSVCELRYVVVNYVTSVCELRYVVVNYVTVRNSTCTTCKHNDIGG
jgi:hypothetical protein